MVVLLHGISKPIFVSLFIDSFPIGFLLSPLLVSVRLQMGVEKFEIS